MNCIITFCVFTIILVVTKAITVSPSQTKPSTNTTATNRRSDVKLNIKNEDRLRRRIPYMTFYLPNNGDAGADYSNSYKFPSAQGDINPLPQIQFSSQPQKIRQMIAIPVSNHQSQPPPPSAPPPPLPSSASSQSIQLKPIVYFAKFQPQLQQQQQQQQQQHQRTPSSSSPALIVYDAQQPPPPPSPSRDSGTSPGDYHPQPSFTNINALPHISQKLLHSNNYHHKKFPTIHSQQQHSSGVITQSYYQAQRQPKRPPHGVYTPFLPSNKLPGKFVPMQQPSNLYHEEDVVEEHHDDNINLVYYTRHNNLLKTQIKKPSYIDKPIYVTSTGRPTQHEIINYTQPTQPTVKIYYSTAATNMVLGEDISPNQLISNDKPTKTYTHAELPKLHHLYRPMTDQQNHVKIYHYTPITFTTPEPSYASASSTARLPEEEEVEMEKSPYQGPKYLPTQATYTQPEKSYEAPLPPQNYEASKYSHAGHAVQSYHEKPYQGHKYQPEEKPYQGPKYLPEEKPYQAPKYQPEEKPYQVPKYLPEEKPYQVPKYLPTTPSYESSTPPTQAERYEAPETESEAPKPSYEPKFLATTSSPTPPPISTFHPTLRYYMPKQKKAKNISRKPAYDDPGNLAELLKKLQENNDLPETITADNIDSSIKTLVKILNNLKRGNGYYSTTEKAVDGADYDYKYYDDLDADKKLPPGKPGPNSGRPGVDYPNYDVIPETSFSCQEQRYKGFFGDLETNCQVWHYCDLNGGKASFLCPNGTIFNQIALTCDWWFNVDCRNTPQQYVLNERLYKYILPFKPKFPEDYSGPLVDKYLAMKFEEMEEKMRRQKEKGAHEQEEEEESSKENDVEPDNEPTTVVPEVEIQVPSTTPETTIVESEQVRLIEIKTDGISGHLLHAIPSSS